MHESYDLATHTILAYGFKFSRNFFCFIRYTYNGDIRYKFYNKLVQSLESPYVKDLIGSHMGEFVSNSNDNLKREFLLANYSGIVRLELTFHRHSLKEEVTKDFILTHMS